jgi:hypothetical protein
MMKGEIGNNSKRIAYENKNENKYFIQGKESNKNQ